MSPVTAVDRLPSVAELVAQLSPDLAHDGPLAAPAERGVTTMADRVVEKITTAAVEEVELATGAVRRFGRGVGRAPKTRVRIDGKVAILNVEMSVLYPSPLRSVTRVARAHIVSRITELTGLEVKQLDINVVRFPRASTGSRVR